MADEKIFATGLKFPEGPAFDKDGTLYLVELAGGRVTKITPDGEVSVLADMGGSPNGLAFGPDRNLYVCNSGARWAPETCTDGKPGPGDKPGLMQRVYLDGRYETLISEIDGVPLNSPNDVCFDSHGGFYFTDPIWPESVDDLSALEPGSLCYSTIDGDAKRMHTGVMFPNGLGVTEDGSTLIVLESGTGKLLAFPILEPGVLGEQRDFAYMGEGQVPDGMCFDSEGRILAASHGGNTIFVFPPTGGNPEHKIDAGDVSVTNVCFGGPNFSTLYITQSDKGQVSTQEWKTSGMVLFPDR